jgi:murein DD-endopeptidase MepM/ murein hydrolase activator NlpD
VTDAARRVVATGLVLGMTAAGCALVRGRDDAIALRARDLMVPVAGVDPRDLPDTFDATRDGGSRRHEAIDIPAARGTAVVSADEGVVLALHESRRGGLAVYATDPDRRFVYYYAHLAWYRAGLREGTAVARGDVLGAVGTSGNADPGAPHLHFQLTVVGDDGEWRHGRAIDPRPFLVRPGRVRRRASPERATP